MRLKQFLFAASVDQPADNEKFAESLGLDYPILSDPDKSVAKAYGVLRPMAVSPTVGRFSSAKTARFFSSTRK